MRILISFISVFIILFITSCAIQVSPTGGEKDVLPPKLISSTPKNYSTNFSGHDIRLDFDEYIALNEIGTQLIVSPLLNSLPEIKIRKKSLFIHFDDTLLANTTYTFNFGLGIMDNNEGNKLENFQFVISTGDVLDSNYISGKISFAFDKKTEKGILASLYKPGRDSMPLLERPMYFSKTNDSGQFRIINIAPGNYTLIALKEKDGNYLYLPGEEFIGFNDSTVKHNTANTSLYIFREEPGMQLLKSYSEFPGKAVMAFSAPLDSVHINYVTDTAALKLYAVAFSEKRDTINFWYRNIDADSIGMTIDTSLTKDTVYMRLLRKQSGKGGAKQSGFVIATGNTQTILQHLHLPYFLQTNKPIEKSDFSKIELREDSLVVPANFTFSDSLHMKFQLNHTWKQRSKYDLLIPAGTFTNIYGEKNDSVQLSFTSHGETDYGSMKINFLDTDNRTYLIQLTNEAGVIFKQTQAANDTTFVYSNLDPGTYKIKIVSDRNKNSKWDTGNYLKHIQPEDIRFYPEPITVRANWDVDVTVK